MSGTTVIDGKAIAQDVRNEVRAEIAQWASAGRPRPGSATILVGDDPASAVHVAGKQKACAELGIEGFSHHLPVHRSPSEVEWLVRELNADPRVSGILLQLPTPDHINGRHLTALIDPAKDVDRGWLTPLSAGPFASGRPGLRPCTPLGVIDLLRRHDVPLDGAEAMSAVEWVESK